MSNIVVNIDKQLTDAVDALAAQFHWTPIIDGTPHVMQPVLVTVQGDHRRVVARAAWVPKHTVEDTESEAEFCDYDEKTELYYWPEGWYEAPVEGETWTHLSDTVTHWMPLPPLPPSER